MASKAPKKTVSTNRAGSATNKEAASIATTIAGDAKKKGVVIWPEWSDADINNEKWDVPAKGKDKAAKSPVVQHFFEDPDGKVELPTSLKVDHWKRPQDFVVDKTPVIVDPEGMMNFDLMVQNEEVHESELVRWFTSQIIALWKQCAIKNPTPEPGSAAPPADPQGPPTDGEYTYMWRPWEHIYAINKPGKGPNIPAYNPAGKYVVKLYWMGCWRKIIIDDTMPFDENEQMMLPSTSQQHELWPMLLAKAIIKIASIDYSGGSSASEFGDFSVIQCLTGWLPETIPLQPGHLPQVWDLLRQLLPEFKLPELPPEQPEGGEESKPDTGQPEEAKESKAESKEKSMGEKSDVQVKGKKEDKKDKKDDKKDKKDKDKAKEKTIVQEEAPLPEHPEVVVFASYSGPSKYPVKISALREMTKDLPLPPRLAEASERLRQSGLSHMYPHPVLLTQTRSCPLEPPPPPEKIPAWKLIRPRKKKTTPSSDEPICEPEEEKPIQCLELSSPFLNYRVSPVPIPTDTHRPKSALERGSARVSSRPGTANQDAIEETDENAPEQDPPQILKVEEMPKSPVIEEPKAEETKQEEQKTSSKEVPRKKSPKAPRSSKSAEKEMGDSSPQLVSPSPKTDKSQKTPAAVKPSPRRQSSATTSRERMDSKSSADSKDKLSKDSKTDKNGKTHMLAPTSVDSQLTPVEATIPEGMEGEGGEGEEGPEEEVVDVLEEEELKNKEIWMDFDNFCKCFKTLIIFHKSATYPHNYKDTEPKSAVVNNKDKKSAPNTAAGPALEEKSPYYMFVDSLKPTEIVVSFSSLCRWNDSQLPPTKEEVVKVTARGKDKGGDRDSKMAEAADSASVIDAGSTAAEPKPQEPLQPGMLVAEAYSWKSLHIGHPILRLRTTSTRAAVLSLPEGRHVLRFSMTAPLGYHIHLCSSTPFVFGDEEKVMAELTKESCRFVDNATQVMLTMGKCVSAFHDADLFQAALEQFYSSHCPYRDDKKASKHHHLKIFNEALYTVLMKVLNEANLATPEMAFAWRAFNFDVTTKNILGLPHGAPSRPATGVTPASERGSASKKGNKRHPPPVEPAGEPQPSDSVKVVDHWKNREITLDEHIAGVKIQKSWRGYYVRKCRTARTPGTEENLKVQEQLLKAWAAIEPSAEQNGLLLFRTMFKHDSDLMPKYPFYKDEWNKISYADYQGTYPDQPANTWFVVFREIFHVTEEMLCVPKLYTPIPSCMLRVVDNDTGNEIPRVFQKVAPCVYKKNKRGYTFVAEARTLDQPLQANRWRMRLIGSLSPLPGPFRNEVNSSFHTRELRDYYLPNDKNVILRYTVKVTEDHVTSVQMMTSKSDVYIKLVVLDNEEEVMSSVGKGHVVLPAVIFQKDVTGEEDSKRSSSRSSNKGARVQASSSQGNTKAKRSGSATSRSSTRHSVCSMDEDEDKDVKTHKYIIQAIVLRNSWPLSESQWAFVQMLKELEKNELKVAHKERPPSPPKTDKAAATKGKDKGKAKGKEKGSRPPSQQFDLSKPNWTLRVVSDGNAAEEIEVKKDTERADEIRAMKKAWEEAEPGRAAKAQQSRRKYLDSHMIKAQQEEEEVPKEEAAEKPATDELQPPEGAATPPPASVEPTESEGNLTLVPPPPPAPKTVLQKIDLSPFIRQTCPEPRLRDEEEIERQMAAKQAEIQAYRSHREDVEAWRDWDRQQRNMAKIRQLELCEQMQAALDHARESINEPREAFRQKFLEAERKRLEEIAAQEAALQAEASKTAPSPKGRKSAKGKKSPAGKKKK